MSRVAGTIPSDIEWYDSVDDRLQRIERGMGIASDLSNIPAGSIDGTLITPGSLTYIQLALGTITADRIQAATITATQIAAGTITANKIAAGTITANEIAANTITGNNIFGNTITGNKIAAKTITSSEIFGTTLSTIFNDMGQITAGTITGGIIQTNSGNPKVIMDNTGIRGIASNGTVLVNIDATTGKITATGIIIAEAGSAIPSGSLTGQLTASQIANVNAAAILGQITAAQFNGTFGGSNMIINSGFESATALGGNPTTGWAATSCSMTGVTTPVVHGTEAMQLTMTGGTGPLIAVSTSPDVRPLVLPGIPYTWSAYVRSAATSRNMQVAIRWLDSGGSLIGSEVQGTLTASSTTAWTRLTLTATSPSNAAKVALRVYFSQSVAPANGEIHYVDSLQFEQGDVVTAYAPKVGEILPGTVGNTEIAALAVTAAKIAANTITASQIAANTITATQITAHTITAGEIAAATITSTEIAANAITANHIAAGSIDTTKITISNLTTPNIMANSSFETAAGASGWEGVQCLIAASTGQALVGSYSLLMQATVNGGDMIADTLSNRMPVFAGFNYTLSGYLRAAGTGRTIGCTMQFFNSAGAVLQTNNSSTTTDNSAGWTRVAIAATSPAGAVSVRCYFQVVAPALNELHYLDAVQLERNASATAYQPSGNELVPSTVLPTVLTAEAITTDKIKARAIQAVHIAVDTITANEIAANAITSNEIAANTIVAGDIAANTITSGQLTATAIDGMTITGALIRTSAANPRVELTAGTGGGIKLIDSGGNTVVLIPSDYNGSTKVVYIKGTIESEGGIQFPTQRGTSTKLKWFDGTNVRAQIDGFYDPNTSSPPLVQDFRNTLLLQTFSVGSSRGAYSAIGARNSSSGADANIQAIVDTTTSPVTYYARSDLNGVTVLNLSGASQNTSSFISLYAGANAWSWLADNASGNLLLNLGGSNAAIVDTTGSLYTTGDLMVKGADIFWGDYGANATGPWFAQWEVATGRWALFNRQSGAWAYATFFAYNNGTGKIDQDLSGVITTHSDVRAKTAVQDLDHDYLKMVSSLRPRKFRWKDGGPDQGLVAQEVEKIYPHAVRTYDDGDGKDHKGIDYSKITLLTVGALGKMVDKMSMLEDRVSQLEAQLA